MTERNLKSDDGNRHHVVSTDTIHKKVTLSESVVLVNEHSSSSGPLTTISKRQPFMILEDLSTPLASYSSEVKDVAKTILRVFLYSSRQHSGWVKKKKRLRVVKSITLLADALERFRKKNESCQPLVKYFHDKLLAKVMLDENPYPVNDEFEGQPIYTGELLRILRRKASKGNISFFYSLQKGSKQAWPELPASFAAESLKDHIKNMTKRQDSLSSDVADSIKRVSNEIFDSIRSKDLSKVSPTLSACLQKSRKEGGNLSLFQSLTVNPEPAQIGKVLRVHHALLNYRSRVMRVCHEKCQATASQALFHCEVAIIPEPGKFRIITKGDGYLYTGLQPLQGALLNKWKGMRESTFRHQDLTDKVSKLNDPDLTHWASVDYKAATDTLSIEASYAALTGTSILDEHTSAYLSFSPSTLGYPRIKEEKKVIFDKCSVRRSSGQLMGHPLSFPLLCTINLSVWRLALLNWSSPLCLSPKERKFRIMMANRLKNKVLINGDDMLAKVTLELYDCLLSSAQKHGFKLSPGKNYCSERFAMMNSQLFEITATGVKRRGYLNQRLITGFSPKSGESKATPMQICAELNKMYDLNPVYRSSIFEAMHRFHDTVFRSPVNWNIPVHLGGYGLRPAKGEEILITRMQRLVAAHFINHSDLSLYKLKSEKGHSFKFLSALESKSRPLKKNEEMLYGEVSVSPEEDWSERVCMVEHLHTDKVLGQDSYCRSNISRDYRLSPVTLESLGEYWEPRFAYTVSSACPPVGPARFEGVF